MCRIAARAARRLDSGAERLAVIGLPAQRRSAAERLAVTGLELGLAEVASRLAEVPVRSHAAERSAH